MRIENSHQKGENLLPSTLVYYPYKGVITMKNSKNKALALLICLSMLAALSGCGSTITGSFIGNESESESEPEDLPFEVAEDSSNMSLGQIGQYDENLYFGLACVRVMDSVESEYTREQLRNYNHDIPVVFNDQEVIYPLIQVFNNSDGVHGVWSHDIALYADSVQIETPDLDFSVFVDGLEIRNSNQIDSGKLAIISNPFIVDKGWSEIKVFYEGLSWTITPDDVQTDPYTFSTIFAEPSSHDFTEPGEVIYSGLMDVVYDGSEIRMINQHSYIVFEFTLTNNTNDTLKYYLSQMGTYSNSRGYNDSRLLVQANHYLEDNISGYSNLYNDHSITYSLEIHPGMSAQYYIAFETMNTTGVFDCYFDPEFNSDSSYIFSDLSDLELAHACVEIGR